MYGTIGAIHSIVLPPEMRKHLDDYQLLVHPMYRCFSNFLDYLRQFQVPFGITKEKHIGKKFTTRLVWR